MEPDECLPSEQELQRSFGVSRTVVRQALGGLQQEGLVYRLNGKGTFVGRGKILESQVQQVTGFFDEMASAGRSLKTAVLRQEVVEADIECAAQLQIPIGSKVIEIERLRIVDGVPFSFSTAFVPYAECAGLERADLSEISLYKVLSERYGKRIVRGERTIECIPASHNHAKLLGVQATVPLAFLVITDFTSDGTILIYSESVHRGDRAKFKFQVVRNEEAPRI
jgi:GntR family transcriptional regulator